MDCTTPRIDLPNSLQNDDDESVLGRRRHGSTEGAKPTHQIVQASDSLKIYIGFQLDGVSAYRNLTDTKDLLCCDVITFHETVPRVWEVQTFGEHIPGRSIQVKVRNISS